MIFLIDSTVYIPQRASFKYSFKNFNIAQKGKRKTGAVKFYAKKFYESLKYCNTA